MLATIQVVSFRPLNLDPNQQSTINQIKPLDTAAAAVQLESSLRQVEHL
jgi:hypothetical protein